MPAERCVKLCNPKKPYVCWPCPPRTRRDLKLYERDKLPRMTTDGGWPKHGPIKELEPAEPTQSTYLKCNRPPCTTEDSPHSWAYKECTKAYGKEICQLLPVHGSKVERINDSYQSSYIFNPRATAIPHTTHSLHHDPVETPTPISFPSPTA